MQVAVAVATAALLCATGSVQGQTNYDWKTAADGNWNVNTSWNPTGVPTSADSANISVAGTYTVTLNSNQAVNNLTLNNANATISQGASTLTVGGTITLSAGPYTLGGSGTISGGSITSGGGTLRGTTLSSTLNNVTIGNGVLDFSASASSVLLTGTSNFGSGATVNLGGFTSLGFMQDATQNNLAINFTGSNGSVSVNGNNTLTLGTSSTITNTTGTNSIVSDTFVAGTSTFQNKGTILNSGTGSLSINPDVFVNQSGGVVHASAGAISVTRSNGEINQSGGQFIVDGGTLSVAGTSWVNNGTITLSSGTLNLGGTTTTANLGLAGLTRTGGSVNLTGTLTNTGATLALNAATGSFGMNGIITGGSITSAGGSVLKVGTAAGNRLTDVSVGVGVLDFSTSSSQVQFTGTTTLASGTVLTLGGGFNTLTFGQTKTLSGLTVNITNSNSNIVVVGTNNITLAPDTAVNTSGSVTIDTNSGGTGTLVNQGLIQSTASGVTNLGNNFAPGLTFTNSGALQSTGTVSTSPLTRVFANQTNFTNFSGGTLTGGSYLALSNGRIDLVGLQITTLAANTTVQIDGTATFEQFSEIGYLTTNAGTFKVTGGKTYDPPNSSSITNTGVIEIGANSTLVSDLTVNGSGVLRGSGTLGGNGTTSGGHATFNTTGGTLSPGLGTATGVLTVGGNLTLNGNTTVVIKVNGNTAGTAYDQVKVNGNVTLGNAVLGLSVSPSYTPTATDFLVLLNKTSQGAVSGTFFNLPDNSPVTVNGVTGTLTYFGDADSMSVSGGNDVVIYFSTPVPEPGCVLALAAGGVAVAGGLRRRIRKLDA
jgi:hypothetical protein